MSRIRAADKVERAHLKRACKTVDDIDGLLASERFFQKFTGIVDTTGGDKVLCLHEFLEFLKHLILEIRIDSLKAGNFKSKSLHLVFAQMLHHF